MTAPAPVAIVPKAVHRTWPPPPPARPVVAPRSRHEMFEGAKAIEVAAMLGDSVVGVKHCIDPTSGKVTATTWALFAVGVACAARVRRSRSASSVDNAAYNKGAYDY